MSESSIASKAALFLASGALIHGFKNAQDMREMGGLALKMPYTFFVMALGSLALAGIPFFSGAYSKDLILETAYTQATFLSRFSYILGIFAAFFTAAYSTRLLFLVFISEPKKKRVLIEQKNFKTQKLPDVHDVDNIIIIPLSLLIFGSIFSGTFLKQIFAGTQFILFKHSIQISSFNLQINITEFLPKIIK